MQRIDENDNVDAYPGGSCMSARVENDLEFTTGVECIESGYNC